MSSTLECRLQRYWENVPQEDVTDRHEVPKGSAPGQAVPGLQDPALPPGGWSLAGRQLLASPLLS